jgi:hypothetical protein
MTLLALSLGGAAASLVACGDRNGLIPADRGDAIKGDLDKASSNFDAQECKAAEKNVANANDKVIALPSSVDAKLKRNLADGVQTVENDIAATCGKTQSTQTQTTETQTTQTETTQTETTPTETTPTETTPTETTPTETTPTDGTSGGTIDPSTGSGGDQSSPEQKNSFTLRGKAKGKRKKHHRKDKG